MTDAINICFYAGPLSQPSDESSGGAVWTTIRRDDMSEAEDWLRRTKPNDFGGHPIHSQTIHLTDTDVQHLNAEGVRAASFVQQEGEAVVIAAGIAHQVACLE